MFISVVRCAITCCILAKVSAVARAEVIQSAPDHYVLRHEARSVLPPDQLWTRLISPHRWWHPDHTYSGDAGNLYLDIEPSGTWSEEWDGNYVVHGRVLLAKKNEQLRLDAPFGPLQELAVQVVWTITLTPHEAGGTLVVFDERATGSEISGLDDLAPAVDFVKQEAISRLVDPDIGPEDR